MEFFEFRKKIVLKLTWKTQQVRIKKNIFRDIVIIKSFCTERETISKTKRQPTDWEHIFANDVMNKRLFPTYANSSYNLIKKKIKQLNQKTGRTPKQIFLQTRNTDGQ